LAKQESGDPGGGTKGEAGTDLLVCSNGKALWILAYARMTLKEKLLA
jgi:hypothetical protein